MELKKNIAYNSFLTIINYLVPLIIFPYITRVLGANNFGIYNFVDSVVNYFIMFSMMGTMTVGIREVAKKKNNPEKLEELFSSLFFLNLLFTLIALLIFYISIFNVPKFQEEKNLFFLGGTKIFFNLFLIEWLYIGSENFKYITIRTIIIKLIYIASVFLFVKNENDYIIYYVLTIGTLLVNAAINWFYSKKITIFSFQKINIKPLVNSFIILGIYAFLTSMYTSFNVVYLGFKAGNLEVGYYSVATRIVTIILALYTAYSNVLMPHLSFLLAENKMNEAKILINKSFEILYIFCIPIILIGILLAPQIIEVLSGKDYEGAIVPMRIVIPNLLIIGIEQILILQILMPIQHDKAILFNSIMGATAGIIFNLIFVTQLKSVGSSMVWVLSEIIVLLSAHHFVRKSTNIKIDLHLLVKHLLFGLPYLFIGWTVLQLKASPFIVLSIAVFISGIYFLFAQYKLIKNETVLNLFKVIIKKGF